MWSTYDTKLKERAHLQKVNTACPKNLINPRKAKPSQAAKNYIKEYLPIVLQAPAWIHSNLHAHIYIFFSKKQN